MRYYEIVEARRNPEQNPKESTLESLEKYAGRDDVFVSFTSDVGKMSHGLGGGKNISGSKLGINPKSKYNTPIGIYTYPVDYVISKKGKVPFAAGQPFLYVVQTTKPLLDLNNYSKSDFERDSKKLIDMGFADTRDDGIETAKFYTPAAHLWNWTRLAADSKKLKSNNLSKSLVQWPKILRSLGYSGAIDLGSGLIHEGEPTQAVFFSINAVKILEVIPNIFNNNKTLKKSIMNIKNPNEQTQLLAVQQDGQAIKYIIEKGITPSEKVQIAAVQQNERAIQYIDNPSEAVQLAAVQQNKRAIGLIKNPSEAVQLVTVQQDGYAIYYINNPSEQVQLASVKTHGQAIKYIIEKGITPSEKVQLAAVTSIGDAIQYIDNPSEQVQLAAVSNTSDAYQFIKNPSEELQLAAVKQNGMAIEWIIKKGIIPSEQVQLAAVKQNGYAIQYIKNPSEKVKLSAVAANSRAIKYIDNPSEAVKKAVGL